MAKNLAHIVKPPKQTSNAGRAHFLQEPLKVLDSQEFVALTLNGHLST
jgi:hypothetical protein